MRKQIIRSLWAIFWGTLICSLDLNIGIRDSSEFDIFPDILGASLVFWGAFSLGGVRIDAQYKKALIFVQIVALLALLRAVSENFVIDRPQWIPFARSLVFLLELLAALILCLAMKWLCEHFELAFSPTNWRNTMITVAVFYCLPFLALTAWGIVSYFTSGKSNETTLGSEGVLLLLPMSIPLFHFGLSTWRLKREFEPFGY